jgi:hypothetical protein
MEGRGNVWFCALQRPGNLGFENIEQAALLSWHFPFICTYAVEDMQTLNGQVCSHADLNRSCKASSSSNQHGDATAGLAAKYGGHFLSAFDIMLNCSSEDAEDLDLWAEQLLNTAQQQQEHMQAECSGRGRSLPEAWCMPS